MPEEIGLDHSVFAKNRGTPFLFAVAGEAGQPVAGEPAVKVVRLELVEVRDLTSPPAGSAGPGEGGLGDSPRSFSLLFRGPAEPPLAQGTYPVEHAEMGSFLLFIVPVARDGGGVSYEAIFNRT